MEILNISSLVLGIAAWILPGIGSGWFRRHRSTGLLHMLSFSTCALALVLQLFYNLHLVRIEDWSAIMDTTGAVALAGTVLLVGTIASNLVLLLRHQSGRSFE